MLSGALFQESKKAQKVVVVLELKPDHPKRSRPDDSRPNLILMLSNGHCVALGGNSPIVTFFPSWMSLAFFTEASLDNYEFSDPSEFELPEEWDTSQLPLGPFG